MCYDNCFYRNAYNGDCIYGGHNVPVDGNCQLVQCEICTENFSSNTAMVEVDGTIYCPCCHKDYLEELEDSE